MPRSKVAQTDLRCGHGADAVPAPLGQCAVPPYPVASHDTLTASVQPSGAVRLDE